MPNGNYYVADSGRVVLRNMTLDDIEAELRILTAIDAKEIEELYEELEIERAYQEAVLPKADNIDPDPS
jgi:hypothetical protein